jgi:hypothetical protein
MRHNYPDDLPIFATLDGHEVLAPSIADGIPTGNFVSADGALFGRYEVCPLTPAAVRLYEACGGTMQTAVDSFHGRRGRRPNLLKLWSKAFPNETP